MPLLSNKAEDIYLAICDLFEAYMVHVFVQFGGMTLEQFAADSDAARLMTRRLHSALQRILASSPRYAPGLRRAQTAAAAAAATVASKQS